MSVDRTIDELHATLAQLGHLVEHINGQLMGITARINTTLENFDTSVAGIAQDAGTMTGRVGETVAQIPHAWVFYLLFLTFIVVLVLLAVLLAINLVARIHAVCAILRGDGGERLLRGDGVTPLPSPTSVVYPTTATESKHVLNVGGSTMSPYPHQPMSTYQATFSSPQHVVVPRSHITVPMETEPRRYGGGGGGGSVPNYSLQSTTVTTRAAARRRGSPQQFPSSAGSAAPGGRFTEMEASPRGGVHHRPIPQQQQAPLAASSFHSSSSQQSLAGGGGGGTPLHHIQQPQYTVGVRRAEAV